MKDLILRQTWFVLMHRFIWTHTHTHTPHTHTTHTHTTHTHNVNTSCGKNIEYFKLKLRGKGKFKDKGKGKIHPRAGHEGPEGK